MKTEPARSSIRNIPEKSPGRFPIVGIGASAGGLEALEQFLTNVPKASGMAYVVIQHLDPTQKGFLPELLQRISGMKVYQVKDRMVVKPDCIYVIPPNKSMSILKGMLYLFEPVESRGLRLPVDFFFRSLADDQKDLAIGAVLSGMGSDGSSGIRAIKEQNGIVMVQEPSTAKFDSMPRNAIESVLVDIVAPAHEMHHKLVDFLNYIPVIKSDLEMEIKNRSALDKIIILLRMQTGSDFSLYKKNTIYRRIERRMSVHRIDKIAVYVHFLQENPKEVEILFKELLIGVTNFFRDPLVWKKLEETVIPDFISRQPGGTALRAWIPGCSTGEEAYSLAIVFKEALEKIRPSGSFSLQIFASDLDNEAIEIARKGAFPANIVSDISPERLSRFFVKTDDGYRISNEIREMVVFAQHNIIMHPPFTKIDILTCRNLLIYLEPELQKKLLGVFHYSLNPGGILLLGSSESLGNQGHLFSPTDVKLKFFKRSMTSMNQEMFDFPSSFSRSKQSVNDNQMPEKSISNIQTLADQVLLQKFSPAGVLVNESGDILYISGRTGKYLEPAVGKANMNIFAMLREGLRNEFPVAFRKAILTRETVVLHNLKVGSEGTTVSLDLKIQWNDKPEPLKGTLMIIFNELPDTPPSKSGPGKGKNKLMSIRESELEEELVRLREEMQNTMEEMQTSQEELKSTNEELQSTNEELQSTNEELTTSKEEMQSLNEELQTVNAELQSKVDDFSRVNNDMKNLLNSTDIATLFLDKELNIRRFTIQATKIFKLIKSDIGRPFTDQASDLIYPELATDALEVLRTLVFIQKLIPASDGRWFSIRIMPYRTSDDRIDGLVITFINTTDLKQAEVKLNESEQINRILMNSSPGLIIKLSADLKILELNPRAEVFFGKKSAEAENHSFVQSFIPEQDKEKIQKELNRFLWETGDGSFEMPLTLPDGIKPVTGWVVKVLYDLLNKPVGLILTGK
ncbi:MAG: two-component system chemotaxis family CheB/CheR fusion protein [Bacteroidetes bacterium]|nr:MAG: two-component system chemotaxis family CheB/CheR fusion protein [Bacteroidota bacterium]